MSCNLLKNIEKWLSMKYNKPHAGLMYGVGLIVVVISIGLMFFATAYIPSAYLVNWAILVIVLFLCITPFGHHKLIARKDEKPRHDFVSWLWRIFALQLALFFTFLGIAEVCAHWLPALTTTHPNALFLPTKTFLINLGLFPWTIFALYAGGLGYVSYCKNKDAQMSSLLTPLFSCEPETLLGIIFNLQARLATTLALSITFAFITLLIVSLITPHSLPFLTGFHAKTTIIVMVIILFGFTPPFKRLLTRLLNPKIPLFLSLITVLILFAVLMLLLNSLFFHAGQSPIHIPYIIQWMKDKNWATLWLIFSLTWWICWTPLIASHIARLSRGHRIRSTMIATLILPAFFTLLLILFPEAIVNFLSHYPYLISLIALAGFIYLLWRLTEKSVLPMLIRSYLPKRDQYKRRDHYFYFRKVFQVMLIVIYLYLPAGMAVTSIFIFALALPFTLQILLNAIASLMNKHDYRKKE